MNINWIVLPVIACLWIVIAALYLYVKRVDKMVAMQREVIDEYKEAIGIKKEQEE